MIPGWYGDMEHARRVPEPGQNEVASGLGYPWQPTPLLPAMPELTGRATDGTLAIRLPDGALLPAEEAEPGLWRPAGDDGPCWCDWCKGRAGVHGPEAVALYQAECGAAGLPDYPEPGEGILSASPVPGQSATITGSGSLSAAPEPAGVPLPVHAPGCDCTDCAAWVAEFLAILCEPLGWPDEGTLPSWDMAPPGTCYTCHRGPVYKDRLCPYCWTLRNLGGPARRPSAPRRDIRAPCSREPGHVRCGRCLPCRQRAARRRGNRGAVLIIAGLILGVVTAGLQVPAMVLLAAGLLLMLTAGTRRPR